MSRKTERRSASTDGDRGVAPPSRRARPRIAMGIVTIALALLVGGLGGFAFYLLSGTP